MPLPTKLCSSEISVRLRRPVLNTAPEREGSTINEFYTVIREHQSNPDPQVSAGSVVDWQRHVWPLI